MTQAELARLGRSVERHERDLYGVGHERGIGLMSRVNALERTAQDQRSARRWLIALMVTTAIGAAQVAAQWFAR